MATQERPKSEASKLYKDSSSKTRSLISTISMIVLALGILIAIFMLIVNIRQSVVQNRQQAAIQRSVEAQQRIAVQQQVQAAQAALASEEWVASWGAPSGAVHQMGKATLKEFLHDRNMNVQKLQIEIQPPAGSPAFETATIISCVSASRCTYTNRGFDESLPMNITINREDLITGTLGPKGRTSSFCLYRKGDFQSDPCPPVHRRATAL